MKTSAELIAEAMSLLGKRTSQKKADAARKNAKMPPRQGSRPRGRPKKQS